jgi:hypothetical protein
MRSGWKIRRALGRNRQRLWPTAARLATQRVLRPARRRMSYSRTDHGYYKVNRLAPAMLPGEDVPRQELEPHQHMFRKIVRLFVIKTRVEAFMIIYALALGAVERGSVYLTRFPGFGGKLLFLACTGAVFMAGGKILDCMKYEKAEREAAGPTA